MADTMVELLTGQTRAEDLDIEVQITMPFDSLLDPHRPDGPDGPDPDTADPTGRAGRGRTAHLVGHGPLPLDLAREIIGTSQGRKWWRRLFTAPSGQLIGGDPTRRRFDGWLARLISLRDQTCRDPFCDAPIRHYDHIHPLLRRRPHHLQQRPRHLRPRQPGPRDARLAGPPCRLRQRWTAHRSSHHSHRTQLPQPCPGPTLIRSVHPRPVQVRMAAGRGADHADRPGVLRSPHRRPSGLDEFAPSAPVGQLERVGAHMEFVGHVERRPHPEDRRRLQRVPTEPDVQRVLALIGGVGEVSGVQPASAGPASAGIVVVAAALEVAR